MEPKPASQNLVKTGILQKVGGNEGRQFQWSPRVIAEHPHVLIMGLQVWGACRTTQVEGECRKVEDRLVLGVPECPQLHFTLLQTAVCPHFRPPLGPKSLSSPVQG